MLAAYARHCADIHPEQRGTPERGCVSREARITIRAKSSSRCGSNRYDAPRRSAARRRTQPCCRRPGILPARSAAPAIRILRPRLDLRELQAADRMIDHHERVIRQAHHARDISRSDFEGGCTAPRRCRVVRKMPSYKLHVGQDPQSPIAVSMKSHWFTTRSIARRRPERWRCASPRVRLAVMALYEQLGRLAQQHIRIQFHVREQADCCALQIGQGAVLEHCSRRPRVRLGPSVSWRSLAVQRASAIDAYADGFDCMIEPRVRLHRQRPNGPPHRRHRRSRECRLA